MKRTRISSAVVALTFRILACANPSSDGDSSASDITAAAAPAHLDVDDVAILLPLPKSSADDALPRLSDKGTHGVLFSDASFKAMIGFGHVTDDATFASKHFNDPTRWRIVSLRADPCARLTPGIDETSPDCHPQLRLVAQALESGSGIEMADQALHLIYDVAPADVPRLAKDLAALKAASTVTTNGKALAPHPGLAAEPSKGPLSKKLHDLILTYAGQDKLSRAAAMFTLNAGTWMFVGAENHGGQLVHVQAPCGAAVNPDSPDGDADRKNNVALVGTTGVIGNFITHVSPSSTCADNINLIVDSSGKDKPPVFQGTFWKATDVLRDAAIQSALRIDNPKLNTLATVECVSCHHATRGLARAKGVAFLDAKDGNPNRFVPPAGVTSSYAADATDAQGPYAVHAFGYLGLAVSYTQRLVNEASVSADQWNRILAKNP
jgi:hypothetical protein